MQPITTVNVKIV